MVATGVLPPLIRLLQHPDPTILIPALHTFWNMSMRICGDRQTAAVINARLLPALRPLLFHAHTEIRQEAMCAVSHSQRRTRAHTERWRIQGATARRVCPSSHPVDSVFLSFLPRLSPVAVCGSHQIQACLDAGLLSVVIESLLSNSDEEQMLQCVYALANALNGGSVLQVCRLVTHTPSVLAALNVLLASSREFLLHVALRSLERVMQVGVILSNGSLDAETAAAVAAMGLSGHRPFTARVAATCMRNLHAVASSNKIDLHIASDANRILKTWWSKAEAKDAMTAANAATAAPSSTGSSCSSAARR